MRINRIIASAILAASMIISAGCSLRKPAAEGAMTATQIAEEMGIGLNLGNTMDAYNSGGCETTAYTWIPVCGDNTPDDYERQWGAPITTQECVNGIKAAGFDTIRIPVFWGNMMVNDGTYTISPDYMARVREIVDYAQNAGLYTVINIHHFDEFIIRRNSLEECEKIFTTLWTQIAEEFIDYPYTLVFEGYNEYLGGSQFDENGVLTEPEQSEAYNMVNRLNQTFVDAVRDTGGNNSERVLIVSGYWTNIDLTTADEFIMPKDKADDRLMVSVHYVDNAVYWSNKIGGQEWLNYIDSQCALLKNAFTDKGIPVFVGETTGIYPKSNFAEDTIHTDSTECLEIVLDKLNEHGFVPVLWDTNNNFYNRTSCVIKNDADRELISRLSE